MRIFTPIFSKSFTRGAKALTIITSLLLFVWQSGQAQTTFTQSNLNLGPGSVDLSTYLQFGPDGRLYVAELYGRIKIYTITKDGPNNYRVTNEETLLDVYNIPNHDDDGDFNPKDERQVTSLVVAGTASNPVIYVASSDPWSGGPGGDINKDTNSGMITRLTWTGSSWSVMDLVRGLPASEENHASHGLELATINGTNYLLLCSGGQTNAGSPSQNFAWTTEYALSAAILAINLDQIDGMSTKTAGTRSYKYTLPTVDDPTRPNVNGIIDPNQAGYDGIDVGDPWGGNDGLNQAKIVPGGPVQILSPGYRNSYDLVVTEDGALYVTDNGANAGWGGFPENEGVGGNATNNYRVGEPGSSTADGGEGPIVNQDHLTLITNNLQSYTFGSFYGGHPNPIRSNPNGAGLFTKGSHSSDPGDSNGNSYTDDWFRNSILNVNDPNFSTRSLPVDWPPVPVSEANPVEGDYRLTGAANPDGPSDELVTTLLNNSNGIDEYTASGDMKGNLIIGRSNGSLHRIVVDANGNLVSKEQGWVTGLGSDANALGITCNGDNDPFPGTIWVGTFNDKIVVLEPNSGPVECILPGEAGYDPQGDNDSDGFTNADEDANGTDLCSANSKPDDFDDDKVSDLTDLDDDNDGINDEVDPFQMGEPFNIPVTNELFNNQSLLKGYKGLGMTGVMNNGDPNPNYLNWLDDPDASNSDIDDILGGAIGAVTIYQTSGDAGSNNQEKAYQYGVNVDANTGKIIVSSRMLTPFHNFAVGESQGIYIGTGFQDNYIKIILTNGGLEVQGENNDVALAGLPTASIAIPSSNLDLFFEIDPATGVIQAAYSQDGGTTTNNIGGTFTATGALLSALQNSNIPLAVGIIGTSGSNPEFAASWDFLNVKTEQDVADGEVIFRVNAGGSTLASIDDGSDWVTDIDVTLATDGFEVNAENNVAFGPPSSWDNGVSPEIQSSTPFEIFQWERWDIDDPEPDINMTYNFNVVDPGDYKVRLFFRDTYSGTAQPGQRVFNVLIDNVLYPQTTNIDISANPGPDLGTVIEVDASTADGILSIEFVRNLQSPMISGIEIIKGGNTGVAIQVQSVPNQTNQEGDNANITVVASGGDGDLSFVASGLPAGVSIDPTNGLIGGTIDAGAANNSPYNVVVTVDDNDEFNSDAKTVSFVWTITTTGGIPDTWTNITNVTEHIPRHENSMVQVGDKFYIFGGRESPNVVEVYDYNTNTWSTISNGPGQFNHFQATAYQGMIWVIGAFADNNFPNEVPEEFIWIYDPANNEWIQGPSIPAARRRGSAGLVVYNDKFYVAGGNTVGHAGGYVPWFDEYDPATNTWTPLADAPNARDHFHSTVSDGKLYLAGGRLSGGPGGVFDPRLEEVDVYDFSAGTWSTLPATSNLPTPRGGTSTVTFQGEVVVIGGEGDGQAFNTVEALNPGTGQWRALASMNNARHGTQAIVSGDGIHISSGSPNQGGGSQNNMEVYGIDNPTGTALVASTLNVPTSTTIGAAATETITIDNSGGNTGIVITGISLGGDNASDFAIAAGDLGIFLIPAGGVHQIQVTNNGGSNQNVATLTIAYGASSSQVVTLNQGVPNTAPTAAFTATPTSGPAPLNVAFDASTSSDADLDPLTYSWAFGDGNTGTGETTSHTYAADGIYNVTLTVSDGQESATANATITVGDVSNGQASYRVNAGGNTLTAVDGGLDWVGDIGATLAINGFEVTGATNTAFGPPPGWDPAIGTDIQNATPFDIFDWERWDQDDPEPEVNMTYTFNMANPGNYKVRLFFRETFSGASQPGQRQFTVTLDGNSFPSMTNIDLAANPGPNLGTVIEETVSITDNVLDIVFIRNIQSPMVSGIEIIELGGEVPIVVQAISNQSGVEGDVVSLGVQASGGDGPLSYVATGLPDGLTIAQETGLITGTIAAGASVNSPFSVQVTVDDNDANSADAQLVNFEWVVTATPPNTPPVAAFTATPTNGVAPLEVSFDAAASSDADLDPLTYSWAFGDGNTGTGLTTTHTYLAEGVYTATLTVSDGEDSGTATEVITVGTINNGQSSYRVNAGGATLPAVDGGLDWVTDIDATLALNGFEVTGATNTSFGPPSGWDPAISTDIQNSTNFDVFDWERWDQDDPEPEVNMTYTFNMGNPGTYIVRLFLRETFSGTSQPGQRQFSVTLDGNSFPALTNIDLAASPGPDLGTVLEQEVTIIDNLLDIAFIRNIQSPMISGIEILQEGGGEVPIVVQAISNQSNIEGDVISLGVQASGGDGTLSYQATGLPTGLNIDSGTGFITGTISTGAAVNSPFAVQVTVDDNDANNADAQVINFQWDVTAPQVNTPPVASFTATPTSGTAPLTVAFDASASSDADLDPLTYNWDFGDTNSGTGVAPSHTYTTPGTYVVTLTVSDGEDSATATTTITVNAPNQPPIAAFVTNAIEGTAPLAVTFDASISSDPDEDPLTYSWAFGDGNTASGVTFTHTYTTAGTFTAVLTVSDGQASSQTSIGIIVNSPNSPPLLAFSANPTSGTAPLVVNFDASATVDPEGDPLTFNWTFGDGNSGTGAITSHTFENPGVYTVSISVSDGEFTSQGSINITVEEGGCQEVVVDDEDFESGWGIWNDAGTDARRSSADAPYANSGIYCVRLRDNSTTSYITSDPIDLSTYEEVTVGLSFLPISMDSPSEDFWLQVSTDGANYQTVRDWDAGIDFVNNERVNEEVKISGPFSSTTRFRFRVDASSNSDWIYLDDVVIKGCSNAGGQNQAPLAQFETSDQIGQAPFAVTFNASQSSDPDGDPLTYTWDFGDGNTGTGEIAIHTYQSTGTFTAKLTVSDGQASTDAFATIFVSSGNAAPVASFTANPLTGEAPLLVSFDASNSSDPDNDPLTYAWTFGDGNTGAGISPTHTYQTGGVFTATLTVSDGTSSTSSSVNITVTLPNQGPTAAFSANPSSGEAPLAVSFDASGSSDPENDPLTYIWAFGDGNSGAGISPNHTYVSPGVYTVTLTVSDGEFSDQSTGVINALVPNLGPTAAFTATPTTGDSPLPVSFDASASTDPENDALTYSWAFGDGNSGTGVSPSHTYVASGTFTVTLTVSDGQNSDQATTVITVNQGNRAPTATIIASAITGVAPFTVSFDGGLSSDPDDDPLTYSWTFGDGDVSTIANPSHTFILPGTYSVVLTVSDGQLSDQSTINIEVTSGNQGPAAAFTATPNNGTVPLTVSFDASTSTDPENDPLTYSWAFGDGGTGTGVTASHEYLAEGVYTVTLTVSDGEFSSTANANITVEGDGCNVVEIDAEDFELGWGIWNDGGADARRTTNDASFANSGIYTVRLRDNSSSSHMTTDILNLSSFEEITVDFSFIAISMDNLTEDFWLRVSTDGGASYTTVGQWRKDIEFENDVRYFEQVTIPGPFTANTRLRFQCDASTNSDWVYIDDVIITGCTTGGASGLVVSNESSLNLAPSSVEDFSEKESSTKVNQMGDLAEVLVFPNPTRNEINIRNLPADATLRLFDLNGRLLLDRNYANRLDLSKYSKGVYILSIHTENAIRRIKVVKD